jgi:signal transduction histidine kinase
VSCHAPTVIADAYSTPSLHMGSMTIPFFLQPHAVALLWGRLRPLLGGTVFLALLVMLLIVLIMMQFDAPDYEDFDSFGSLANFIGETAPGMALMFLVPLPFVTAALNLAPRNGWRRLAVSSLVTIAYGAFALWVGWSFFSWLTVAGIVIPVIFVFEFRHRALRSAAQLVRRQVDATDLDVRVNQSRMQLLRAQIEPHFLFNTLANVRRLAHEDAAGAAEVLGHLISYLQAALPHARSESSTLGDEAQLIDAYLRIHQIRMGGRLSYEISIPAEVARDRIPSMMMLTLIENAIKHGINPLTQGGHVLVRAAHVEDTLELTVADSGRGMSTEVESGTGTGLANIRTRLELQYGHRARLALARGAARGFTATITLPRQANT